ncbi:thiamine pyrophosphate-binding protein [Thermomicrobium roseum]|uniref:Acetolactate synthase n=1 Tax=Thermomicrobium roseum (strain ATCC 27502 / DSM 5159 / P-2) TaxID=309801 RepID=B9KZH4_THERP|nr:thiamine pyrophosphate-binding protein [Thermomicrobium roseum]ACM05160.1 acetolactate synthase [Thermomicrobium roseum DSM 5159]
MERTAWQILVDALQTEGISYIFGMPGSPKHLYDALYDASHVRPILVRHETAGAFMAYAFARVSGSPACCFGCPGPGVANLVPGILEAWSGCVPVLALGVRAPMRTFGMGAFQEADHVRIVRPITKWAATVEQPERTGWYVRRALTIATNGQPGPVYLEIPADIALRPVSAPPYQPALRGIRSAPDPDRIEAAVELLRRAERPLLICGSGAIASRAFDAVRTFVERLGVPLQVTPGGRGILEEEHPLFAGLVGLYRTEYPRSVWEESDLLVMVGTRMEEFQSGNWTYFPAGARLIQIDIAAEELGRNWVPDVAIQADARLALEALLQAAERAGVARREERVRELTERQRAAIAAAEGTLDPTTRPIRGKFVAATINRVFDRRTILVMENGAQDLWTYYWPYYRLRDTGAAVPPAEQTAMGLGVCGAIGAALARPDWYVVCTTGDGAFQMGMHELPTAVEHRLRVTWVIFNDQALGWPRWTQKTALGGRVIATEFAATFDFVAVAKAAGCYAERVEDPAELVRALERARKANETGQPAVIDVRVDSDEHHPSFVEFHRLR